MPELHETHTLRDRLVELLGLRTAATDDDVVSTVAFLVEQYAARFRELARASDGLAPGVKQ